MDQKGACPHGNELLSLAQGPTPYVKSYSGCVTNGYKFHTLSRDTGAKTQNSGVLVVGNDGDGGANIDYYGVLTEVFTLEYTGGNEVVFFRCNWWDIDPKRGVKVDKYGFVSVNSQRLLNIDDPFVLAAQSSQVFYVNDISQKGWRVVVKVQPRDSYELAIDRVEGQANEDDNEAYQENASFTTQLGTHASNDDLEYTNVCPPVDAQAEVVDVSSSARKSKRSRRK